MFGNPGSAELPLMDAMAAEKRVRYILGLQEIPVMAMAEGYAVTGSPGVTRATMSRVEQLEKAISEFSRSELQALRQWVGRYDSEVWDRQIEADAKSGKLTPLPERALRDHRAGRTSKL